VHLAHVRDIVSSRVRTVMTTQVTTVDESASLEEAMEAMHRHNCRHRQAEELHHMQVYIHGAA